MLVRTGETLPVDGIVSAGSSDLQEDRFNGESMPRAVGCGDAVFAGTVNVGNALEVDATGSFAESRLAALQKSIEEARLHKPAAAQLADYIASYFIGAVLLITVSTALVWMWVDPSRAFWIARQQAASAMRWNLRQQPVGSPREIALFPPMTGG